MFHFVHPIGHLRMRIKLMMKTLNTYNGAPYTIDLNIGTLYEQREIPGAAGGVAYQSQAHLIYSTSDGGQYPSRPIMCSRC